MTLACFGLKLDRLYTQSKRCPSLFITLTMMLSRYFKCKIILVIFGCLVLDVVKRSCVYPMLRTSMRHQRSIHTTTIYILLFMQRFRAVYDRLFHESLTFSRNTHETLGECLYEENASDKWDTPWNAVANRINAVRRGP